MLDVDRSRSEAFVFVGSYSHTATEVRFLPAAAARAGAARDRRRAAPTTSTTVDHRGDLFYILTNDRGRNFRLVTAPVATPDEAHWRELVPHRDAVMLEEVELFATTWCCTSARTACPSCA